jgi:hypothetical protein
VVDIEGLFNTLLGTRNLLRRSGIMCLTWVGINWKGVRLENEQVIEVCLLQSISRVIEANERFADIRVSFGSVGHGAVRNGIPVRKNGWWRLICSNIILYVQFSCGQRLPSIVMYQQYG